MLIPDAEEDEGDVFKPSVPSLLNQLKKGVVVERDEEIQVQLYELCV